MRPERSRTRIYDAGEPWKRPINEVYDSDSDGDSEALPIIFLHTGIPQTMKESD